MSVGVMSVREQFFAEMSVGAMFFGRMSLRSEIHPFGEMFSHGSFQGIMAEMVEWVEHRLPCGKSWDRFPVGLNDCLTNVYTSRYLAPHFHGSYSSLELSHEGP